MLSFPFSPLSLWIQKYFQTPTQIGSTPTTKEKGAPIPILQQHFQLFQFLTKAGGFLGGSNLVLDNDLQRLTNKKDTRFKHMGMLWCVYLASLTTGGFFYFMCEPAKHTDHTLDKIIFAFNFASVFMTACYQTDINTHSNVACQYVNNIISLPLRFPVVCDPTVEQRKKPARVIRNLNLLLAYTVLPSASVIPFALVLGLYWNFPCKPGFIGYNFIPECRTVQSAFEPAQFSLYHLQNAFTKVLLTFINLFVWSSCGQSSACSLANIMILCQMTVADLLKKYVRILLIIF